VATEGEDVMVRLLSCSEESSSTPLEGWVYDIERFAIHDGPGIRTILFLKGCPLRCLWCSSPQTQASRPELLYLEARCKRCGHCVEMCSKGVIALSEIGAPSIARKRCDGCGQCAIACPEKALKLVGRYLAVDEVMAVITRDTPYYRRSGGGVTLSGGEPTMQPEFSKTILRRCKNIYIHTAMETCGYMRWETLNDLLEYLDLLYLDIKHMDDSVHKRMTGVSNRVILQNAKKASALCKMIVRIPVVPGLNDSDENIRDTAEFARGLGKNLQRIELLPYHGLGVETYRQLGRVYSLKDVRPLDDGGIERLTRIVESCGLSLQVGG
jgi:pyruvate formate lyase activating enzyme